MARKISRIFFLIEGEFTVNGGCPYFVSEELKVRTVVADRMRFSASVAMALLKHMSRYGWDFRNGQSFRALWFCRNQLWRGSLGWIWSSELRRGWSVVLVLAETLALASFLKHSQLRIVREYPLYWGSTGVEH